MKKITSIILLFITLIQNVIAQNISFFSPEFEIGVKKHLGLAQEDDVLQIQTDTITIINLSGLGICDVRDVLYLPNIEVLNLSHNGISNIFPLIKLDSLRILDVSSNLLESINPLVFSNSEKMNVNVSYNFISDFSFFFTPAHCQFSLYGIDLQSVKNAPYFDIYQFCADVDADGVPVLNYRGYTNMEEAAFVDCGTVHAAAVMDGDTYTVSLSGIAETTKAYLGNGKAGDTTYVVPPAILELDPGQSITFETGLPEGYSIRGFSPAQQGTMQIDGTKLTYTAADDFESEEYMFAYYEGAVLRGFSKVTFQPEVFIPGDVNGDKKVLIGDVIAILNYILGDRPENFKVKSADINNDGLIVIGDVIAVLNIIVGQ